MRARHEAGFKEPKLTITFYIFPISQCIMLFMKTVADLTTTELTAFASEAWSVAAQQALAAGHSVTGSRDGRRIRYYPDGRIEDLGPVADIPDNDSLSVRGKSGRSVA